MFGFLLSNLLYIGARDANARAYLAASKLGAEPGKASPEQVKQVAKKYGVPISRVKTHIKTAQAKADPGTISYGYRGPRESTSGTALKSIRKMFFPGTLTVSLYQSLSPAS